MTVEGDFPPDRQIFVGVSSCLLGEKVRYDGSDRQMPWLKGEFPQGFTPVPVCPEVEVGMGVPRETVALRQGSSKVRMIASKSGIDHTQAMESWAHQRTRELSTEPLSGFILKSRSPSCGVEDVPIEGGEPGSGLFARALREFDRWLPRVTEETLGDRQERGARTALIGHGTSQVNSFVTGYKLTLTDTRDSLALAETVKGLTL